MITIEINEDDRTDGKTSYSVRITERLDEGKDALHHIDKVTTMPELPDLAAAKCWLIGWLSR